MLLPTGSSAIVLHNRKRELAMESQTSGSYFTLVYEKEKKGVIRCLSRQMQPYNGVLKLFLLSF